MSAESPFSFQAQLKTLGDQFSSQKLSLFAKRRLVPRIVSAFDDLQGGERELMREAQGNAERVAAILNAADHMVDLMEQNRLAAPEEVSDRLRSVIDGIRKNCGTLRPTLSLE